MAECSSCKDFFLSFISHTQTHMVLIQRSKVFFKRISSYFMFLTHHCKMDLVNFNYTDTAENDCVNIYSAVDETGYSHFYFLLPNICHFDKCQNVGSE